MLFDLSGSIAAPVNNLPADKAAATGFVNALSGTPSIVGVYTFGTTAPAPDLSNANLAPTAVSTATGAATVTGKINGLTVPANPTQATNWDAGLWQIANAPTRFDVVLVLTDGDPTVSAPTGTGPGHKTRFIDIENGIFSANAIKAASRCSPYIWWPNTPRAPFRQ